MKRKTNVKETTRCLKSGQNINKLLTCLISEQVLYLFYVGNQLSKVEDTEALSISVL